jgi:mono/diheme cytochrome c family protein
MDQKRYGLGRRPLVAGVLALVGVLVVLGFLLRPARPPSGEEVVPPEAPSGDQQLASGKHLYSVNCAPCHGDQGDGNGPAARYLYPRPRNFGEVKFRVVSTANLMPSDADLLQVLERGMPGSAMFPFRHLPEADRQALVAYVRHLTRTAVLEQQRAEAGGKVDLAELSRDVDQYLQPGAVLEVPADLPAPGAESVARGTQLYRTEGCSACHGPTGKGDGAQDQRDSNGVPIRPRDFGRGFFKGGPDPRQLFARIILGMPGTPMPASSKMKPADAGDLINFILSLSDPAVRSRDEHRRVQVVARRTPTALPADGSAPEWDASPAARVAVSPLWWRNVPEPDLQVAALHDGETLALRLSWHDPTRDDRPLRPQDFEDMAAVQLVAGPPEPFLGMGAVGGAVDVWLWQASRATYPDMDAAYPHMAVDLYPFKDDPEFRTARAAGNLRADPDRSLTGNNLGAQGVGTMTLRPRPSQLVSAAGAWRDGRWTVVLRRPLTVPAEAGVPLAVGGRASIAFALWDGAARDRNGQKLVSIWHDLRLE